MAADTWLQYMIKKLSQFQKYFFVKIRNCMNELWMDGWMDEKIVTSFAFLSAKKKLAR